MVQEKVNSDSAMYPVLTKLSFCCVQGGTFTLSNLGMYGVKNFSAIINPPQVCSSYQQKVHEVWLNE